MKRIEQAVAFVVFLLAVAAMDSQLYITAGVMAITSSIYLLISIRKEQRNVYGTRGSWPDSGIRETKGTYGGPDLGEYYTAEGRKHG